MAEQLLSVAVTVSVAFGVADEVVGSDIARPQHSKSGPRLSAGRGDSTGAVTWSWLFPLMLSCSLGKQTVL